MWIGRFASTAPRWWNHETHIPLGWVGLPTFDIAMNHVSREVQERARNVFPDGDIILKGVYWKQYRSVD